MNPKYVSGSVRLSLTALILCLAGNAAQAKPSDKPAAETPWGKPADGLACRLVVQPRYVFGQAITVVVEVKNVSDRKRYLVPWLDPLLPDHLAIEITGPGGRKVVSHANAMRSVGPKSYEAIAAGEVRRFEVPDLREQFPDLHAFQCKPARKASEPEVGEYAIACRFQSPKVPERFAVGSRIVGEKTEKLYEDPAPELVAGQWTGTVTAAPVTFQLAALGKDDLVVHEWGVFTVFNDAKYANANRKEEWGALPSFFYRQFPKERLRWVPAAWDKPVVYFYAKATPMRVNVKVTFAEGAPVVWWPAAAEPVDNWPSGEPGKKARPFRSLMWEAWLGDVVPATTRRSLLGPFEKVENFPLPADCWLREARLPDAARLTVVGNTEDTPKRKSPGVLDRPETERFLYYDGLVPAPDYLRCEKLAAGTVTLRNRAGFDLARLFLVDRRDKKAVGFAVVDGKKQSFRTGTTLTIEPKPVAAEDWPAAGIKQVRQALLEAGLFEAEANVLLKVWQKQLLEADGITAFHILPADEYDRMLPLDILPAPATRPVRVGIALHPHIEVEPVLAERVGTLIRQLDDKAFNEREAASKALLEIGPLAINLLRAELKKGPPLETRRRIEAVLERLDASDWLDVPGAAKKGEK